MIKLRENGQRSVLLQCFSERQIMAKYLLKRLAFGLLSAVAVVAIVMVMIYSLMDRNLIFAQDSTYSESPNGFRKLILVEIGNGFASNLNLAGWNPRDVLADNDLTATFLQNFHDYIALRLATFPEGTDKTLTLSEAVFYAIWDDNGDPLPTTICREIDRIIVNKHWRLNNAR